MYYISFVFDEFVYNILVCDFLVIVRFAFHGNVDIATCDICSSIASKVW